MKTEKDVTRKDKRLLLKPVINERKNFMFSVTVTVYLFLSEVFKNLKTSLIT